MKKKIEKEELKIGYDWIKSDLIELDKNWAIVVGIVKDRQTGEERLRIGKGKVKKPLNKKDPITLLNRINIKNKNEWEAIKKSVDKYIKFLPKVKKVRRLL